MKANKFVVDEILKIVNEFANENELVVSESSDKIIEALTESDVFRIDSEKLGFGGENFFCLSEFQESDGTDGDEVYFTKEFERIKKIIIEKSGYEKYEFIFIVRSISRKILLEQRVTSVQKRSLISKGMSARNIDIKAAFLPEQKNMRSTIGILSNIQSLEYMLEEDHIASIYTAKLFDLVELYNIKGDSLFSDNVRFQIADKLDVDKKIETTLREEPDKFWLYNNGITLLADRTCIDAKKQYSLSVAVSPVNKFSIINGAQTISAASHFFYSKNDTEEVVKNAKENAYVVLRVVFCDKGVKNKELYSEISVSLNRQKAITEVNMRYTDQLIDDINMLYEEYKVVPYFYIAREGEKLRKDAVDVADFAKISALYLLQQPGVARASKSKVIKADDYWNRLRLAEYESKTLEEVFCMKYTPFLYVRELFGLFSKKMKQYEKTSDISLSKWCSYGTEFLIAYIVWQLNGCNNEDFSSFKAKEIKELDDILIKDIIRTFARYAQEVYGEVPIESNVTKLDSEYKKVRDYIDKNGVDLFELIKKMK